MFARSSTKKQKQNNHNSQVVEFIIAVNVSPAVLQALSLVSCFFKGIEGECEALLESGPALH